MSILASISNAISGLTAQSSCIGNISDNLANSSTTGYKSLGTNFSDLVSTEKTSSSSSGLGVQATPLYYNSLQGAISSLSVGTYMAISGRGFFPVTLEGSDGRPAAGSGMYYTRSGDFTLNGSGSLANSEGFCLMGWPVDPDTRVVSTGTLAAVQVGKNMFTDGVVTSEVDYKANLPGALTAGKSTSKAYVSVYDSDGREQKVSYTWTKTADNTWTLDVDAPGGAYDPTTTPPTEGDFHATAQVTFNPSTGYIDQVTSADCSVANNHLGFTLMYPPEDPTAAAVPQPITASLDGTTQFTDTTVTLYSFDQNGAPKGSFSGVSIDENGFFALNYDNGVSRTYFQIPVATFISPEHLQRETGTAFIATETSGGVTYNAAGSAGAGKLVASALESSTVDIADQFARMIQAQQAYSANAKTITAADSMLKTLTTL